MRVKTRSKTTIGVIVGLAIVLAACGDDGVTTAPVVEAPAPTTVEPSDEMSGADPEPSADASVDDSSDDMSDDMSDESSVEAATATTAPSEVASVDETAVPQAIISLSPTATEMVYAIGAGDQVLAVDDFSNFPEEAMTKMQGVSAFEPNVESIVGLEPDLVLTDGTNPDLLAQFDTLGIAHWEGPAAVSFDDVYAQIERLGAVTGHVDEASELVAKMRDDVAAIKASVPARDEPLTYYHELDPTLYSVTSDTFIGAVYSELGLVNIADAVGDGSSYPQLNAEYVIQQNPDLIFLACTKYCGETAETLAARPGWGSLDALSTGGVIEMDDDVASRWGPRIVDYFRIAADAVSAVSASAN